MSRFVKRSDEECGYRDILDTPMYIVSTAARLVSIPPSRAHRWLKGYKFDYKQKRNKRIRISQKEAVIAQRGAIGTGYASFLDLIDLLFVNEFLKRGISLQKIRKALDEVRDSFGCYHFAKREFFTSGKNIYIRVRDSSGNDALWREKTVF